MAVTHGDSRPRWGETLDIFCDHFPDVSREHAQAVVDLPRPSWIRSKDGTTLLTWDRGIPWQQNFAGVRCCYRRVEGKHE